MGNAWSVGAGRTDAEWLRQLADQEREEAERVHSPDDPDGNPGDHHAGRARRFDAIASALEAKQASSGEIDALVKVILETGMEQHPAGDCECRKAVARLAEIARAASRPSVPRQETG